MTIVVAAAAPDGVVLASDSRMTMSSGRRHRVASDHAPKVFAPFQGIGFATYGSAFIGERTIAGVVEEFAGQRPEQAGTMIAEVSRDAAEFFGRFLTDAFDAIGRDPPPGALGIVIAGYDPEGIGRLREIRLPPTGQGAPVIEHEVSTHGPGVLFRGRTRYIRRMLEGYDQDGLGETGVEVAKDVDHELRRLGYIPLPPRSHQDALGLATFVVRMTVDMERLTDGTYAHPGAVPACGGETQALLVSRGGTRWIARPRLRLSDAGVGEEG